MSLSPQERGQLGNQAAREKNPDHQRDAGKKGIRALAARYFDGSIGEAMSWLRSRRTELQVIQGLEEKQAAELASGKDITCTEFPVFCDPDSDPSYWRDKVRSGQQASFELPF